MKRLAFFIVALCSFCYSSPPLMARDEATYPAPVLEYAEQTGPNHDLPQLPQVLP